MQSISAGDSLGFDIRACRKGDSVCQFSVVIVSSLRIPLAMFGRRLNLGRFGLRPRCNKVECRSLFCKPASSAHRAMGWCPFDWASASSVDLSNQLRRRAGQWRLSGELDLVVRLSWGRRSGMAGLRPARIQCLALGESGV